MRKLIYARPMSDKGRVVLGIGEDGEAKRYSVPTELFESLELSCGKELCDAAFDEISEADRRYRATKKALSLLSISDVSERALVLKLRRAGYSRQVAEGVAFDMVSLGYINEKRQLKRLVLREANEKLRGRGVILPRLISKGYSARAVGETLDGLIASGEVSFSENAERLLEKMLPSDASEDERKKLLYKYGYGASSLYD